MQRNTILTHSKSHYQGYVCEHACVCRYRIISTLSNVFPLPIPVMWTVDKFHFHGTV